MTTLSRRTFLRQSAVAAGVTLLPWRPHARVIGANDDIRIAVVGFRGKGSQHISVYRGMKGVRLVAVCDPDQAVIDREVKKLAEKNETVETYRDLRKLLENPDIDAISIATPHHWHALATIWACQAGKDVYVEKPASHNVWEGRRMFEAARKYGRIVQHGTQKRSDPGIREAVEWVKAGNLGKLLLARGLCYKRRGSIGKVTGPQTPPASVDHDLWTGPAPMKPLQRRSLHYDWHWIWDTGNGDLGNQGIHEMDICRWFNGAPQVSSRVVSIGGRFGYVDDGETPNTQIVYHEFDGYPPVLFEVRGLPLQTTGDAMPHYQGVRIGNVIHCEGGTVIGGWALDRTGAKIKQFKGDGGGGHFHNFIQAMRSRKVEDLKADILEGHLSSVLCHTGSISHRLGQTHSPDEINEQVKAQPDAVEAFARMKEHLAVHAVDLAQTPAILGPWLTMDPKTERFVGPLAEEANQHLSRAYREPFVIRDPV